MNLLHPERFYRAEDKNEFINLSTVIESSIKRILRDDRYLLQTGVSERSVCHRLAVYMEEELKPDYCVDIEYNRGYGGKGDRPKKLDDKYITIDIAAHVRKLNDNQEFENLIAIEMKKAHVGKAAKDDDKERLIKLTDRTHRYGYKAGYFVLLNNKDIWIEEAYAYNYEDDTVEYEKPKRKYKKVSTKRIERLAYHFREAIDDALYYGKLADDFSFNHFPRACCGDTCCLLGQYLLDHEIPTWYICGMKDYRESHAWLCTTDPAVERGIIIDITGDQFKDNIDFLNYSEAVFVGNTDGFHDLFRIRERREIVNIMDMDGPEDIKQRLWKLYGTICGFVE